MFDIQVFKTRLKEAREAKGLKQEDLAIKIGIARANVSYYENPKNTGLPNADILNRIIEALDVSYDYLIGNTTSKVKENIDIAKKLHLSDKSIEEIISRRVADDLINCRQLDIADALNIMLCSDKFCDEFFPNFYNFLNNDTCAAITHIIIDRGIKTENTDGGNIFLLGMVQALTGLKRAIQEKER